LAPRTGTGERYATQIGELWSERARTLTHLDRLAADPERLDDGETLDTLGRLQYTLHVVGEQVYGLAPPPGTEAAHRELWAALEGARDATAEVVDALEDEGPEAAALLVHEWRGALFRVRLARLRLVGPPRGAPATAARERRNLRAPLLACLLFCAGAAAFVFGATAGDWPLWTAGMLVVCGSALGYRP
jgi:hypothetical protein